MRGSSKGWLSVEDPADHCVDWRLGRALTGHAAKSTREMRWEQLKNGDLLAQAATHFDVVVTVDRNIVHQQNLGTLPVAVVVLVGRTNRLSDLLPLIPALEAALTALQPRSIVEVALGGAP